MKKPPEFPLRALPAFRDLHPVSRSHKGFFILAFEGASGKLLAKGDHDLGLCPHLILFFRRDEGFVVHEEHRPRRDDLPEPEEGWRTLGRVGEGEGEGEGGWGRGVVCHTRKNINDVSDFSKRYFRGRLTSPY